jgi:outer membrane protein assembly factor BamB
MRQRSTGAWLAWGAAGLLALVVVAGAAALATGLLPRGADDPQETTQRPAPVPEVEEPRAAATIAWQREIGEEPVTHLSVEDLNAVAATGNDLTVVNPRTGSRRWRKVADVGILTDLTTVGDVLVYRTDVLSGISLPYGVQLWESDDVRPAAGGMSAGRSAVYAISIGRSLPEVSAVDPRTGEERWHFHGQQILVDNDAAVASGSEVVVVLQRGVLLGINPRRDPAVTDGGEHAEIESEEWRTEVANPWIETLAASDTEAVFALQNGSVCAYGLSDGDRLWCVPVNGVRDGAPGLLVRNETVVVVARDRVVALDLTSGHERWMADSTAPLMPLVAVDDGLVYTADTDGALHTFAMSDGAPQWEAPGLGDVTALVDADGGVLVGTEDGTLARIEPTGDR